MTRRLSTQERAQRITAWTWAAETLGQEATRERLSGLADATNSIPVRDLLPAIREAVANEERGFLPAPGAVAACARRISGRRYEALQAARRERDRKQALLGDGLERAKPEQIGEIRERIAGLARASGVPGRSVETVNGWRPANAVKSVDDSGGMAAVRAEMERRAERG